MDCNGSCGGESHLDQCNICDGDNTSCQDCSGTLNGSAVIDDCGVCTGIEGYIYGTCYDCSGVPNGENLIVMFVIMIQKMTVYRIVLVLGVELLRMMNVVFVVVLY